MNANAFHSVALAALLVYASGASQRAAPPSPLKCDRNHLTSFTGRVVGYSRDKKHITLRMRTDEATDESFEIKIDQGESGAAHFLMRGGAFREADWGTIESSQSKLKRGMRAIVWVCDDGSAPVIDWRPPES
jgi:hypothetical protein